jgi:hypothetical protein
MVFTHSSSSVRVSASVVAISLLSLAWV